MRISAYVAKELDVFRRECNFTDDEIQFFDLRARGLTLTEIQMCMPHSERTVQRLSRSVREKMRRVSGGIRTC